LDFRRREHASEQFGVRLSPFEARASAEKIVGQISHAQTHHNGAVFFDPLILWGKI